MKIEGKYSEGQMAFFQRNERAKCKKSESLRKGAGCANGENSAPSPQLVILVLVSDAIRSDLGREQPPWPPPTRLRLCNKGTSGGRRPLRALCIRELLSIRIQHKKAMYFGLFSIKPSHLFPCSPSFLSSFIFSQWKGNKLHVTAQDVLGIPDSHHATCMDLRANRHFLHLGR
jgi:hypothetical protein